MDRDAAMAMAAPFLHENADPEIDFADCGLACLARYLLEVATGYEVAICLRTSGHPDLAEAIEVRTFRATNEPMNVIRDTYLTKLAERGVGEAESYLKTIAENDDGSARS